MGLEDPVCYQFYEDWCRMFDASRKSAWYGRLETTSLKIPVIYDPGLPEPPRGQIYLYNSERNAILK